MPRRIELPTEELAKELRTHLQDRKFSGATYDKVRKAVEFPDDIDPSRWSEIKGETERWAEGRRLEAVESLTLRAKPQEAEGRPEASGPDPGMKKRLENLSPKEAEERFNYLQSKSFSELTDAEYGERLALAESLSARSKSRK